jgi:ketosteroid isomerase-like protein
MDAAAAAADTCQAMSQDDAAQVRRAYEVWNESGPAAVIEEFYAEDAVYREAPGWPEAGVFRGREAALDRMQSLVELVGPIQVELDDLIELDDGRFVACVRNVGQAVGGETPYTQSFAVVHRLRDGLIVEADYYLDRAAALDAVGLRG